LPARQRHKKQTNSTAVDRTSCIFDVGQWPYFGNSGGGNSVSLQHRCSLSSIVKTANRAFDPVLGQTY
jgi:hypothetical protein